MGDYGIDSGLTHFWQFLPIFIEPMIMIEPSESYFDNPSLRQNSESFVLPLIADSFTITSLDLDTPSFLSLLYKYPLND
jgi:hypothetical protein